MRCDACHLLSRPSFFNLRIRCARLSVRDIGQSRWVCGWPAQPRGDQGAAAVRVGAPREQREGGGHGLCMRAGRWHPSSDPTRSRTRRSCMRTGWEGSEREGGRETWGDDVVRILISRLELRLEQSYLSIQATHFHGSSLGLRRSMRTCVSVEGVAISH